VGPASTPGSGPEPDESRTDDAVGDEDTEHSDRADDDAADEPSGGAHGRATNFDLKGMFRQFATPMVESLDSRLRDQVEAHVDALLAEKVDAAVRDRLSVLDRAIADLARSLEELERRLAADGSGTDR
jgi:hypothetical protein